MKSWHRVLIAGSAALTGAGLIFAAPAAAHDASQPVRAVQPHLGRTGLAPIATTNDKVDALIYDHGRVYASGKFTQLHFGGHTYYRDHLAAIDRTTGAPSWFRPRINGEVMALALSPDGQTLFVGGHFTAVGLAARSDIAAFQVSTGKLLPFNPTVTGGSVHAIAVTAHAVYFGGTIHEVNGQTRNYAAAVTRHGVLRSWAPVLNKWVRTMKVTPDGSGIILGGGFTSVNNVPFNALVNLSLSTGLSQWTYPTGLIPHYTDPSHFSQVTSLATNGIVMYAGDEGTGHDVFDGTLAFNPDTGKLIWRNTCLGATQAIMYLNGVLYKASHAHDCSSAGGFGQIRKGWQAHHLLALSAATGKLLAWGESARSILQPLPDTNGGMESHLGPYALATDGRQVFVGGVFTVVNGHPQEGLARFEY